jgi:hypothetical protein
MHFQADWLKLIVVVEGLVGISMITASISWLVLIYPALERTRFLAKRTFILVDAKQNSGLNRIENDSLIIDMADRVIQARIDLVLFPILMSFYPHDPSQTLAAALPHLQAISDEGSHESCSPQLRFAAMQLHQALSEFSDMLASRILSAPPASMEDTFQHFIERSN